MGFFVRLRLREDPVGSYPAFSPLPSTISCQVVASVSDQLPVAIALALALLPSSDPLSQFWFNFLITGY
jgi:hypothetical protein